jgi:hypothetical protein
MADTSIGEGLIRDWCRIEVWRDIARLRERALFVFISHELTVPDSHDPEVFTTALDESRHCLGTVKLREEEHQQIMVFIEETAPELLHVVPRIPEEGPTPEDAEKRAQAMSGVLGSLLVRNRRSPLDSPSTADSTTCTAAELARHVGYPEEAKAISTCLSTYRKRNPGCAVSIDDGESAGGSRYLYHKSEVWAHLMKWKTRKERGTEKN